MNWLDGVKANPLARLAVSIAAGILAYALTYYGSKRWNLAEARHKEMGFGAGVAATIIVWLLLQPQQQAAVTERPAETVNIELPPPSDVGNYPYSVQAPNISVNLSLPQSAGSSCGCGCGVLSTQLSDMFTGFAKSFFANAQANEAQVVAAQLAAVPDWLKQYNNDALPYDASMTDTALFFSSGGASNTFLPGGLTPVRVR